MRSRHDASFEPAFQHPAPGQSSTSRLPDRNRVRRSWSPARGRRAWLRPWIAWVGLLAATLSCEIQTLSRDAATESAAVGLPIDVADVPVALPAPPARACEVTGEAIVACASSVAIGFAPEAFDVPPPDSDAYVRPTYAQRHALYQSVILASRGHDDLALRSAHAAGYTLCRRDGVMQWAPEVPGRGWPQVALRLHPSIPLILEAPHPQFDLHTHEEAVYLFDALEARALVVAGTHRCANPRPAGCTGRTSVCGGRPEPYRESDMAHVTDSHFQAAHAALAERFAEDVVISFHGMGAAGASLSNGTTQPVSIHDPIARLASALRWVFPDVPVTSCNRYPGAHRRVHLCGTTNVQGRELNGSPNACSVAARQGSQRFIHFEQSDLLRSRIQLVELALVEAFGPEP